MVFLFVPSDELHGLLLCLQYSVDQKIKSDVSVYLLLMLNRKYESIFGIYVHTLLIVSGAYISRGVALRKFPLGRRITRRSSVSSGGTRMLIENDGFIKLQRERKN